MLFEKLRRYPNSLKERIIHFVQGLLAFNKNSSEMILSENESAFDPNTSILKISNVEDILHGIQERMQSIENMQHEIINRQYRTPFTINYDDRLLCHTIDGHRVLLDNHDPHISIHVIENGSWENHVRYILSKILFIGDTYVDIGANIGLHALYANSLIGNSGTVYCFEPSKKTFKILKENIELNGFIYSGNNHLYNIAIGESDGLTEFEYFEHHAGMSSIAIDNERVKIFDDTKITEQVEIKKLDTILHSHSINVIKIDVEGFEYSVLRGMINILENNKSMKVLLEFDPIVNKRILGEKYNDYVVFINKHFQYIYQIKDLSLEQVNPENLTTFADLLLSNQEVFI